MVTVNAETIPQRFKQRDRWLLWDNSADTPRRPHWRGDFGISWSNPDDWRPFEQAVEAARERDSWGIGYVFQPDDDEYMIDVDGPYTDEGDRREWFPDVSRFADAGAYIEWSPSGNGLHIPVEGTPPEWWSDCETSEEEHQGVDVLTNKFCTFTGAKHDDSGDGVTDVNAAPFLFNCYQNIENESPRLDTDEADTGGDYDGDEWLTDGDVKEALDTINPDLPHKEWVKLAYAVHDYDSGSTGKSLFESWSKDGQKWDTDAKRSIDSIWNNATQGGDVTVATLVDKAKKNGWEVPTPDGGAAAAAPDTSEPRPAPEPGHTPEWSQVARLFNSDEKGSTTEGYNKAAKILTEEYDFVTVRESEALYYYDDGAGFYLRKGETYLRELLNEHLPGYINPNRVRSIKNQVRDRSMIDAEEFTPPSGKVNVKNGVLDLDTRDIEPHSPDYYFTAQLDVRYNESADSELWESFLQQSVQRPGDVKKLEEFIGYALEQWRHDMEKAMFIVGPSQSGKSTFQESVEALFGTHPTVTNLTPQQIADTQFDAAELADAALNSVNDINATKVEDTGTLKRVFSGERTKLERKYEDPYFGAPKAKHLFTANWLPSLVGQDDAFYRRVLIVEFPHSVDEAEKDLTLKDRLKEPEVRQSILNRALDARDRLRERNKFTNDRSISDTRKKWDSWRDAHKRFLYTQFEVTGDSDDTVDKDTYYQAYKEYAGRNDYQLKPKQGVTKSLQWVPEIGTHDDEYSGLTWRDEDAAEQPAGSQQSLTKPQEERITAILNCVDQFDTADGPADRRHVINCAQSQGYDQGQIESDIESLLRSGQLMEPMTDTLRRP